LSNQIHSFFGYFALTCLPNDARRHNNSLALSDYGWYSHDDCIIVDLTSMPESKITVPWLFRNTYIDLEKWAAGGSVASTISELNGLKILYDNTCSSTDTGVPKTFSISVFMKVINPKVVTPISPGATHVAQMFNAAASFAGGIVAEEAGKYLKETLKTGAKSGVEAVGKQASDYVYGFF